QLLIDTLKQNVNLSKIAIDPNAKTLYSLPVDTVYRRMMQVSDNMLAEHLLLLCGSTLTDTVNTQKTIDLITKKYLQDLPNAPVWVDGSGLSRYNLFTPQTNVKLLEKLHAMIPEERLFSLMAIGGKAGTLKGMYKDKEPFIFAKSGTVSGVYNQSGYLKTKSGKTLLFSFMNNNFTSYATPVRKEVERILTWVHENY
ncbi:MAG: D-alanyl-D-alanine carboxypeptidase, partial [Spirosomaceae bacterium]|nr:D-alanyl-D-alanine carboxypeptidase [Spirosomataceae bacterium]